MNCYKGIFNVNMGYIGCMCVVGFVFFTISCNCALQLYLPKSIDLVYTMTKLCLMRRPTRLIEHRESHLNDRMYFVTPIESVHELG